MANTKKSSKKTVNSDSENVDLSTKESIVETVSGELINDNVDKILNRPPSWLILWGTSVLLIFFILIFLISWIVRYPDIISGPLKLIPSRPPVNIVSETPAKVGELLVRQGQLVKQGDPLIYLDNTTSYKEVEELEKTITKLHHLNFHDPLQVSEIVLPSFHALGDLQKKYDILKETCSSLLLLINSQAARRSALINNIGDIDSEINSSRQFLNVLIKDVELYQKQLDKDESKTFPKETLGSEYETYQNKKNAIAQAGKSLERHQASKQQYQVETELLDQEIEKQSKTIIEAAHLIKSDIEGWKLKFILSASRTGKVYFYGDLKENKIIQPGENLMFITSQEGPYYAEMKISQHKSSKVKEGQNVLVKLDSYPYNKYGTIQGRVNSVYHHPSDSLVKIHIVFPKGFTTSLNQEIQVGGGMAGNGEIQTENLRLIQRIF